MKFKALLLLAIFSIGFNTAEAARRGGVRQSSQKAAPAAPAAVKSAAPSTDPKAEALRKFLELNLSDLIKNSYNIQALYELLSKMFMDLNNFFDKPIVSISAPKGFEHKPVDADAEANYREIMEYLKANQPDVYNAVVAS